MPVFVGFEKERYLLYLLPVIIPFGVAAIQSLYEKYNLLKLYKTFQVSVLITWVIYLSFTMYYAKDALKYLITFDKQY